MSLQSLSRRVNSLETQIAPKPRIINCTGARDELLAKLRSQMTEEELHSPVEWSEEDKQFIEKFDAFLAEEVKRTEEMYNVKFVSYG